MGKLQDPRGKLPKRDKVIEQYLDEYIDRGDKGKQVSPCRYSGKEPLGMVKAKGNGEMLSSYQGSMVAMSGGINTEWV